MDLVTFLHWHCHVDDHQKHNQAAQSPQLRRLLTGWSPKSSRLKILLRRLSRLPTILQDFHRLVRKSQQLMLLKLTILIILFQIAVAIAKESTNAASELTLREGLRFEKRMFQVWEGETSLSLVEIRNFSKFNFFAGIVWHEGQEGGNDCLCGKEETRLAAQMIGRPLGLCGNKMFTL